MVDIKFTRDEPKAAGTYLVNWLNWSAPNPTFVTIRERDGKLVYREHDSPDLRDHDWPGLRTNWELAGPINFIGSGATITVAS